MRSPRLSDAGAEMRADPSRVVARLFLPGDDPGRARVRAAEIIERIEALSPTTIREGAAAILRDFGPRHEGFAGILARHAAAIRSSPSPSAAATTDRDVVLGAAFTMEYAVEGAALCNPSAVPHPDQSGLAPGELRVAIALRAIGEGHISSIAFTSAVIGADGWTFEARPTPLATAEIDDAERPLAHVQYRADFAAGSGLGQRVLRPHAPEESHGMEDPRFVLFRNDDGTHEYRATYTAYDGVTIAPRLLVSPDLRRFTVQRPSGPAAANKGMAMFPRRVGRDLLALTRTDGENLTLARSHDGLEWTGRAPLHSPGRLWDLIQSGNCGAPLETDRGWLVLIHGVAPMRVYSVSALLLDLDDPARVIARLDEPLLRPDRGLQDGYVPNVVYSCGALIHRGTLWMPYGVGDARIRVGSIGLDDLLDAMTPVRG